MGCVFIELGTGVAATQSLLRLFSVWIHLTLILQESSTIDRIAKISKKMDVVWRICVHIIPEKGW